MEPFWTRLIFHNLVCHRVGTANYEVGTANSCHQERLPHGHHRLTTPSAQAHAGDHPASMHDTQLACMTRLCVTICHNMGRICLANRPRWR